MFFTYPQYCNITGTKKSYMGLSKTAYFNPRLNKFARFNHGLAHPARIAMLEYICSHKRCAASELLGSVDLSDATIRQHLKVLVQAGFVMAIPIGSSVVYRANREEFAKWQEFIQQLNWAFKEDPKEPARKPFDWRNIDLTEWE